MCIRDRIYTESTRCTAMVDETRQEISRLEEAATRKDGEVSVLENDIFHNKESVERLLKEIDQSASSGAVSYTHLEYRYARL